jgi:hypothetical protein
MVEWSKCLQSLHKVDLPESGPRKALNGLKSFLVVAGAFYFTTVLVLDALETFSNRKGTTAFPH